MRTTFPIPIGIDPRKNRRKKPRTEKKKWQRQKAKAAAFSLAIDHHFFSFSAIKKRYVTILRYTVIKRERKEKRKGFSTLGIIL